MKSVALSLLFALGLGACVGVRSNSQIRSEMAGAWESTDGQVLLLIEEDRCLQAQDNAQMLFGLRYREEHALRTQLYLGQPVPGGLELEQDTLVMVDPIQGQDRRFTRLEEAPEALNIEPFALGTAPPSEASRQAIARGLLQREASSKSIRDSIQSSMESARLTGQLNSYAEQMEFMASPKMVSLRQQLVENDAANTRHITALLRQSGWITKSDYGIEVQLAAFNMVRFGGNLQLMRSVLPALKAELSEDPELGYLYTLLYDSTQLSMGEKQLYGTILLPDMDGRMRMRRIQDKASLDERRQRMGLPPIDEFLANFERRMGPIRVED